MNRNFISALTHAATELGADAVSLLPPTTSTNESTDSNRTSLNDTDISSLKAPEPNSMRLLNPASISGQTEPMFSDAGSHETHTEPSSPTEFNGPSNLLVIYLQACSSALQETKMDNQNTYERMKLFMQILVCISEDQYANSLLHDSNILYSVFLYHAVSANIYNVNS